MEASQKQMSRFTRRDSLVNSAFRERLRETRILDLIFPKLQEIHDSMVLKEWHRKEKELISQRVS